VPPGRELPIEGQVLLIATFFLTVFGLIMVYSASSAHAMTNPDFNHDSLYFIKNGLLFTAAGVVLLVGLIFMPAAWIRKLALPVFGLSLLALIALAIPGVGLTFNGATRWLPLGPVSIQPSEFAKLGVLLVVAAIITTRGRAPDTIRVLLFPIGALVAVVCLLVMLQPDLGTTLAICVMTFAVLIAAGARKLLLAQIAAVGFVLGAIAIWAAPYRRERMFAYLDPWGQSQDGAYQVVQAMIAIGSGGIFGQGLGSSVQKVNFLPEAHTDMIFAVIGEELGLVGAVITIGLFAAFAWAGFTIAARAADPFQRLVAAGATALVAGQAIINLGAVMGALPLTGIPLPLISHGSSSRVVVLILVGLLVAISREPQAAPARPRRTRPADEAAPEPSPRRRRRAPVGA
jgi:cell division protein FtsW